jgi:hypothetical protein
MNFHRLRQPLAVWLALLIAVFGALAHGGRTSMVEVCGATGRHWVDARGVADGSPGADNATQTTLLLDQCPFCRILQNQTACLTQTPAMTQRVSVAPIPKPELQTASCVTPVNNTNLPRGPPACF